MANEGAAVNDLRISLFWAKVQKTEGCWIWTGAKNPNGYGNFGLGNRKVGKAHRFSYQIHKGDIPAGFEIDHLCRNRACVNPDHLEAVTSKVNTLRSSSPIAIHARQTHCVNGHEFTKENTYLRTAGGRYCRACGLNSWRSRKAVANG